MTKALLPLRQVDTPNQYGVTPLIQASRTGDTPLIDLLLKAGAKVSLAHPDGETAVMAAARTGPRRRRAAADRGGRRRQRHHLYQQETALMWAAAEGHTAVVKALLERESQRRPQGAGHHDRRAEARGPPNRRLHRADVPRFAMATKPLPGRSRPAAPI